MEKNFKNHKKKTIQKEKKTIQKEKKTIQKEKKTIQKEKKTIQKEKKSLKKMTKIIFFLKKKNNYSFKEKIINSNLIVHWVNDRN
ncbi:MAG: hypothetical protein ACE19J_00730 [Candidatus Karelsulcia muelleri]